MKQKGLGVFILCFSIGYSKFLNEGWIFLFQKLIGGYVSNSAVTRMR